MDSYPYTRHIEVKASRNLVGCTWPKSDRLTIYKGSVQVQNCIFIQEILTFKNKVRTRMIDVDRITCLPMIVQNIKHKAGIWWRIIEERANNDM